VNQDRLTQLLKDAEAFPAHLVDLRRPEELAGRVMERVRRQRVRRKFGTVAASCVVLGIALGIWRVGSIGDGKHSNEMQSKLVALEEQIKSDQRIVQRLILSERLSQARARLAEMNGTPATDDDPVQRAALVLLYQADRMSRHEGTLPAAQRAYREIIAYFPNTPSAEVARQRLGQLQQQKEG